MLTTPKGTPQIKSLVQKHVQWKLLPLALPVGVREVAARTMFHPMYLFPMLTNHEYTQIYTDDHKAANTSTKGNAHAHQMACTLGMGVVSSVPGAGMPNGLASGLHGYSGNAYTHGAAWVVRTGVVRPVLIASVPKTP
jgi:hypothetical protein